jgi:hypothetical protein
MTIVTTDHIHQVVTTFYQLSCRKTFRFVVRSCSTVPAGRHYQENGHCSQGGDKNGESHVDKVYWLMFFDGSKMPLRKLPGNRLVYELRKGKYGLQKREG